jgi:transcriptional regulator with PAS, ATPase and Fis domain
MISPLQIPWDRIAELNAVRALGEVVLERFRLDLALVAPDGRVQPLSSSTDQAAARLSPPPTGATSGVYERDGHREIAAPIFPRGAQTRSEPHAQALGPIPVGWVIAPGFVAGADQPPRGEPLPVLDEADQQYLRDLVEKVAAEIARYQQDTAESSLPDQRPATRHNYDNIIGHSPPMLQLYRLLDRVIDSDSTVLIEGENGTGKELIAKAIHFNSRRKNHPFVVQNCSAFNDNLLDSELFGHKKGAFTGAISDKLGLFAVADGGTFFLDEIGDMSPSLQVKLLRVLQEGTFIPVGDTQAKQVDVRIIAATNRKLRSLMEGGQFREDLYYRINVINITPPPLRQRRTDIPLLVEHFLKKLSAARDEKPKKLTRECFNQLMRYHWPGNVRELENEIERLVVLSGDVQRVGADLLSARLCQGAMAPDSGVTTCLPDAMISLERNMIYEVLKRNNWNKTRAAQELRISRRNLIRKVQKYRLDPS